MLSDSATSLESVTYLNQFIGTPRLDTVSLGELFIRKIIAQKKPQFPAIQVLEDFCKEEFFAAHYVGGFIRDIMAGVTPRDIDIVAFKGQEHCIQMLAKKYPTTKNRMGGYKLQIEGTPVDMWCIEDSASYGRTPLAYFKTIANLPASFRLNTEAIAVGIWHPTFVECGFFSAFDTKTIEVLFDEYEDTYRTCETICRSKKKLGQDWTIGHRATALLQRTIPQSSSEFEKLRQHIKDIYKDDNCLYSQWIDTQKV